MPIWNVSLSIVACVEADSVEEAINKLAEGVARAGFEPFEASEDTALNAFESEDQSPQAHAEAERFERAVLYGPKRQA